MTQVDEQAVKRLAGRFVVLDGPEGCGKSTQAQLLAERALAAGVEVLRVRDPGSTRIGERIRSILLDPAHQEMGMRCEMLLYMAARAQMMVELILPALQAGRLVVCDRFVSSTLAYQLDGDGLRAEEIRAVAQIAIKGRWPDLMLILDMPAEKSMMRVRRDKDRIEQRPMEYHQRVHANYLSQARLDPSRYRIIPADRTIEQVHEEVWQAAMQHGLT
jgi:dTMP kinase